MLHRYQRSGAQPASPWSSSWLLENLCSSTWSISSPSFTDVGVYRAVWLTCSHFCCSYTAGGSVLGGFFPPFLNYVIPEAPPPSLMGSALTSGGSVLEPAGIGSIRHRGSFWQLLREATSVAPTCYQNLATQIQHTLNLS